VTGTSRKAAGTIAAGDLSIITGEAPPAVLLVDLRTRQVVYTSPVAEQLAPRVVLPVTLDQWSDAAVLRDLDGAALSETTHPLSQVARSLPVAGQAVSAARISELGRRREPLWVVALPMLDAPMLPEHALVVFLPLSRRGQAREAVDAVQAAEAEAAQAQVQLRERAVLATTLAFVVADARVQDMPLVWVNPAFTATTGYSFEEAVGRNCRFLQGPATDPGAVAAVRAAVAEGREIVTTLVNYRKDGTAFWNQLSVSPVHGPDGSLTHFVAIQADVTARIAGEDDRERALLAERRARRDAENAREDAEAARSGAESARVGAETARVEAESARAEAERAWASAERSRRRLELLAEATTRLSATLDVKACRQQLVDLVVPRLADWALLIATTATGAVSDITAKHHDPERAGELYDYTRRLRGSLVPGSVQQTLLGGEPFRRISDFDSAPHRAERESWVSDPSVLEVSDALGAASVLIVPLPGRHDSQDLLILVRGPVGVRYTDDDLDIALDLCRRAGLIVDNARLYEEQRRIAATLQASLLPVLPVIAGVQVAARYRASESGAQVGGDFYELIDLPGHAIGLAVGDVVGHDVLAAAAMGHLRGLLRASAWDPSDPSPAAVVARVDQLLLGLNMATMATMAYARLTPVGAGQGWEVEHTSAGHPPLLVRDPDGRTRFLEATPDLLLGVQVGPRTTTRHRLRAGSSLLAYTDGLIERRGEVLTVGLERLRVAFERAPADLEQQCDFLVAELGESDDDAAFLILHL
jgi:PAS domain S-box-containing protein